MFEVPGSDIVRVLVKEDTASLILKSKFPSFGHIYAYVCVSACSFHITLVYNFLH